jgi:DNA repair exonuclease SbcCD ATPase subunit
MEPDDRAALVEKLEGDLDALNEQVATAETTVQEASTKATALEAEARELDERRRMADSAARDRERLTADLERAKQALAETLTEAKDAAAVDVDQLKEERTTLQEQIAAAEQAADSVKRSQDAVREKERLDKEATATAAHAKLLDDLVGRLGPGGLPAEAMGQTIGRVLDEINGVLAAMDDGEHPRGFQLRAEPGEEFELSITRAGDTVPTPVRCLSGGEALLVGAAIQVAIAELTGFGFVIVDEAVLLDEDNLPALIETLAAAETQSLVLYSRELGHETLESLQEAGVVVYLASGGTMELVGAGLAATTAD